MTMEEQLAMEIARFRCKSSNVKIEFKKRRTVRVPDAGANSKISDSARKNIGNDILSID